MTLSGFGHSGFSWLSAIVLSAQGLCASLALADPPHGRLNPDERYRLRQEVRQHSGMNPSAVPQGGAAWQYQRVPAPVLVQPANNPGHGGSAILAPGGVIQGGVPQSPPPAYQGASGGSAASASAGRNALNGPAGGRLSDDDRRALRQQLREQRAQREATGGSGNAGVWPPGAGQP